MSTLVLGYPIQNLSCEPLYGSITKAELQNEETLIEPADPLPRRILGLTSPSLCYRKNPGSSPLPPLALSRRGHILAHKTVGTGQEPNQ
jgi:hypothetical protein